MGAPARDELLPKSSSIAGPTARWKDESEQTINNELSSEDWDNRLAAARAKRERLLAEKAKLKRTPKTDRVAQPDTQSTAKVSQKQAKTPRKHLPWLAVAWFSVCATTTAAAILLQMPASLTRDIAGDTGPALDWATVPAAMTASSIASWTMPTVPDTVPLSAAKRPDGPTFAYLVQDPPPVDTKPAPPLAPLRGVQITVVDSIDAGQDTAIDLLVAAGASVERRSLGLIPSQSVVRYFHPQDLRAAETVASLLGLDVQHLGSFVPKPAPAVIEILLGK